MSVKYGIDGVFQECLFLKTNPHLAIVDPEIILKAPSIYLKSGILDSLAKWFESKPVFDGIKNPDIYSTTAMIWAKMLLDEINENGSIAINLIENGILGDQLLRIIDLVIYFTGVIQGLLTGRISGGLGHPIDGALSRTKQGHELLHGIKVGYGIVIQLLMEKADNNALKDMISFTRSLGIEPTLKGLNLPSDDGNISVIAKTVVRDGFTGNLPFKIDADSLAKAIKEIEINIDNYV